MSTNLSIKNASDEVVAALKLRAKRNHRSLQGELMAIIEEAAAQSTSDAATSGFEDAAMAQWHARDRGNAVQAEIRQRNIERIVNLMRQGLNLGGQRFSRDEMHER